VDACVHSVLRNPEALLWMSRIKNQNEYTAEHCLNVCVLAIAFGRHLRMSEEELHLLALC
jgi:HD-GYP domain-containing protein (c-di-GMP phosphodiesterase class II)